MFGQHAMDAFGSIDRLGNPQIGGKRAQHIGVFACQITDLAYQPNHIAQGFLGAPIEIGMHEHGDMVRRRLGAWNRKIHILA